MTQVIIREGKKSEALFDCKYCGGRGYEVTYKSYGEYTDNPGYAKFEEKRTECEWCKGVGKVHAGVHFLQKVAIERDIPF